MHRIRRREFLTFLGGAAAAWPMAAWAQRGGPMRRVGALINASKNDPQWQAYTAAFQKTLAKLGWIEGRNLQIDLSLTLAIFEGDFCSEYAEKWSFQNFLPVMARARTV